MPSGDQSLEHPVVPWTASTDPGDRSPVDSVICLVGSDAIPHELMTNFPDGMLRNIRIARSLGGRRMCVVRPLFAMKVAPAVGLILSRLHAEAVGALGVMRAHRNHLPLASAPDMCRPDGGLSSFRSSKLGLDRSMLASPVSRVPLGTRAAATFRAEAREE